MYKKGQSGIEMLIMIIAMRLNRSLLDMEANMTDMEASMIDKEASMIDMEARMTDMEANRRSQEGEEEEVVTGLVVAAETVVG